MWRWWWGSLHFQRHRHILLLQTGFPESWTQHLWRYMVCHLKKTRDFLLMLVMVITTSKSTFGKLLFSFVFLDKNECKQFGVCSHICNNTKGSYKCSCHKYFTRINSTCKADSMCWFYSLNHTVLRDVYPLQWIHLSKTFFCPSAGQNISKQVLYIADDNEIRSLNLDMRKWVYEQTFQGDANVRIDAMDLHVKTNRLFWTNWHTSGISCFQLPSPSSPSGPTSNSHRNTRQSESSVSNLHVSQDIQCSILSFMLCDTFSEFSLSPL